MDSFMPLLLSLMLFAVIHSLAADFQFKKRVMAYFGEKKVKGCYRFFYTVTSILMTAIIVAVYISSPGLTLYTPSSPVTRKILHIFQFFGVFLLFASLKKIDLQTFTGIKQFRAYRKNGEIIEGLEGFGGPVKEKLIVSGVFGWVRHPVYLGIILIILPEPDISLKSFILRTVLTVYCIIGAIFEESRMKIEFGEAYKEYSKKVPMFIPCFRLSSLKER